MREWARGKGREFLYTLRIKKVKQPKNLSATQASLCEDLAIKGLKEKTLQLKKGVLGKKEIFLGM